MVIRSLIWLIRSVFVGWIYRILYFVRGIRATVKLYPNVRFRGLPIIRGNVKWGKNVTVNSSFFSNLYGLFQRSIIYAYDGAEIIIGDNIGLSGVTLNARTQIKIGSGTLIGGNMKIIDHDFHPVDFRFRNPDIKEKIRTLPIEIGEKCFIGGGGNNYERGANRAVFGRGWLCSSPWRRLSPALSHRR